MQAIAGELRLPQTTFVTGRDGDGGFAVRIFSPTAGIGFVGHPAVGTASVLATELADDPDAEALAPRRGRRGDCPQRRGQGSDQRAVVSDGGDGRFSTSAVPR